MTASTHDAPLQEFLKQYPGCLDMFSRGIDFCEAQLGLDHPLTLSMQASLSAATKVLARSQPGLYGRLFYCRGPPVLRPLLRLQPQKRKRMDAQVRG